MSKSTFRIFGPVLILIICGKFGVSEESDSEPLDTLTKLQRIISRMKTVMEVIDEYEQGLYSAPLPKLAKILQAYGGRKLIKSMEKLFQRMKQKKLGDKATTVTEVSSSSKDLEQTTIAVFNEIPTSEDRENQIVESETTKLPNDSLETKAAEELKKELESEDNLDQQDTTELSNGSVEADGVEESKHFDSEDAITAQPNIRSYQVEQPKSNGDTFQFSFDDSVGREQIILDLNKAYQAHLAKIRKRASEKKPRLKRSAEILDETNANSAEVVELLEEYNKNLIKREINPKDEEDDQMFNSAEIGKLYDLLRVENIDRDIKKLRKSKIKKNSGRNLMPRVHLSRSGPLWLKAYNAHKNRRFYPGNSFRRQAEGLEGNEQPEASSDDGEAAPSDDGEAAPSDDGEAAPSDDGEAAPSDDGEAVPSDDGEAAPSDDGEAAPSTNNGAGGDSFNSLKNYDPRTFKEKLPKYERKTFTCGVNTNEGRKICDSVCAQVGFEVICNGPYCSCFKSPEDGDPDPEDNFKNSRKCGPNTSFGRSHCRKSCIGPNDKVSCTELSCYCTKHRNVYKGNPEVDGMGRVIFGHLGQFFYCGTAIGPNNCSNICRGWGHVTCGELACYCDRGGSKK